MVDGTPSMQTRARRSSSRHGSSGFGSATSAKAGRAATGSPVWQPVEITLVGPGPRSHRVWARRVGLSAMTRDNRRATIRPPATSVSAMGGSGTASKTARTAALPALASQKTCPPSRSGAGNSSACSGGRSAAEKTARASGVGCAGSPPRLKEQAHGDARSGSPPCRGHHQPSSSTSGSVTATAPRMPTPSAAIATRYSSLSGSTAAPATRTTPANASSARWIRKEIR